MLDQKLMSDLLKSAGPLIFEKQSNVGYISRRQAV